MSNLKFTSNGRVTIQLVAYGNPFSNSFTANNSAYTVGDTLTLTDSYVEFVGSSNKFSKDSTNYYYFVIGGTGTVTIEGDLISLTNNSSNVDMYQFFNLFKGCDKITCISGLNFPNSIADWCYSNMFMDCTGLVDAGTTLPATSTSRWCYQGMFARCTSLTTPPTILATKLTPFCYMGMFTGCTSLRNGPSLLNTVVEGDFSTNIMFKGCSNLSTIQVNFRDWPSGGTWSRKWLDGVAQEGVFVHSITLPVSAIEATSSVPDSWTLSAIYPATIVVSNQTLSFDALSDTILTSYFNFSYDGAETLNVVVDDTNKPSWLSYTTDNDSINFTANGYSIDSSASFTLPISFSATDAETKSATATFNIVNYPSVVITVSTIPTFEFNGKSEDAQIVSSLLPYATNATSCELIGTLPEGLSFENGVLSCVPSTLTDDFTGSFTVVYSASGARKVTSSVNIAMTGNVVDYSTKPLTIKAVNGPIKVRIQNLNNAPSINMMSSTNGTDWGSYTVGNYIDLSENEIVMFSGNNQRICYYQGGDHMNVFNISGSNTDVEIYGNLASLINWSTIPTNIDNGFGGIFSTSAVTSCNLYANNLYIPAYTGGKGGNYAYMFSGSKLKAAPKLLATSYKDYYYYEMFKNCSTLSCIEVSFSYWSGNAVFSNWVSGVSTYGTFIKPVGLESNRGVNYIPSNWKIVNKEGDELTYYGNGYKQVVKSVDIYGTITLMDGTIIYANS